MSAIAGIFSLDKRPVELQNLEQMIDTMAHRGNDGVNTWCQNNCGLAHRLLWTTPESLVEKQPLAQENLVISADARLDNREELISLLGWRNYVDQVITDSQIILAAYQKWGEQCLKHFLGDFAFAIVDRRNQTLFCARDHFGVKPFYYYCDHNIFLFASEIKAIFSPPEVKQHLNPVRIGDYLALVFEDLSSTFYQDIYQLPPAHYLKVNYQGINLERYWCLNPQSELRLSSDAEYSEAFRNIFTTAVSCRLRSAFPVGSMLSGGLDSSSITCVARNLLQSTTNKPLLTFSAIFNQIKECDESYWQNTIIAQGGIEAHYIAGDQLSPLTDLEQVLWQLEEPLYDFNLFLTRALYQQAHQQGVRVILDGFDGDTVVSHGTGYLPQLARTGKWLTLIQELQGFTKHRGDSFWELFWGYLRYYQINPLLAKIKRPFPNSSSTNYSPPWSKAINPTFLSNLKLAARRSQLLVGRTGEPQTEREYHHRRLTAGVLPRTLIGMNKTATPLMIEPRFPFWDKRLVEFCLALPPQQKLHRGWTRMVLRRAMENVLPPEIQWRGSKTNFGINFQHVLFNFERQRLDKLIFQNSGVIENYVDIPALQAIYQHRLSSNIPVGNDLLTIWKAVTLGLWLETTIDFFQKSGERVKGKG